MATYPKVKSVTPLSGKHTAGVFPVFDKFKYSGVDCGMTHGYTKCKRGYNHACD
jgi:hypothetical protein